MLFFKDIIINILLIFVRIDATSELSIQMLNKKESIQAVGLSRFDILLLSFVNIQITSQDKKLKVYKTDSFSYTISGA